MSEWVRSLLASACNGIDPASATSPLKERIARHDVFVMVGVDALLAGHSDPDLRERAHQAFARKCRELELAPASDQGGSDEA